MVQKFRPCPPPKPSFPGDKVSLHGALLAFAFLAFLATLCFEVALVLAALHFGRRGHLAGKDLRTSLLGCTKMEFSCSSPLSRAHEMKLVTYIYILHEIFVVYPIASQAIPKPMENQPQG